MLTLSKISFPLYKLRSYLTISTNPLGLVKVTTIKGTYILDDASYNGTFEERRIKIAMHSPNEIYKLKEKIIYLRQLVKYRSGTTFIDLNGVIMQYKKSSKMYKIESMEIIKKRADKNWTIINLKNLEQPILVGMLLKPEVQYASIMWTKWGPFLYDLTSIQHKTYVRKV